MKKMLPIILMLIVSGTATAQSFDEWFRQKETRIKYMLQQIAANKVYIEFLQKGYHIAQAGLQTISDIKNGDFKLHSGFINALATVNPKIKNLAKVAGIIALQVQVIKEGKGAIQMAQSSGQLTSSEIIYMQMVFNRLLDECTKNISELIAVITSGQTEMTDDERIKRIDQIYYDMQDKLSFSKSFSNDSFMLGVQRLQEQTDIEMGKKLNAVQ